MNTNRTRLQVNNRMTELTDPHYQASLQSDAELVALYALANQQQALLSLMDRYGAMVAGVIRRIVFNSQDAEDAFQATWLIFMQSAKKIRLQRSVAAWLYGVAYRTACRVRAKSRRLSTSVEDIDVPDQQSPQEPIEQLVRQIELSNLDRELQILPDSLRAPLVEFYILGLTAREIAERMELSIAAVEGRLRRGRQVLRQRLASRGASLSVCAAGIKWMHGQHGITQFADNATREFAQSPLISAHHRLEEVDSYLFELVSGDKAMVTASATKSYTFWTTLSIATAALTFVAVAAQLNGPQRASSVAAADGVQAVQSSEEPATGDASVTVDGNRAAAKIDVNQPSTAELKQQLDKSTEPETRDPFGGSADTDPFVSEATRSRTAGAKASRPERATTWMEQGKTDYAATERTRSKLHLMTEVDFVGHPLSSALEYFSDRIGIRILISEDIKDEQVTLTVGEIPVRDALELILSPHDLAYEVHANYIRVAAADQVGPTLRSYDMSHLAHSPVDAEILLDSLKSVCSILDTGEVTLLGTSLLFNGLEADHRQVERALTVAAINK